MEELKELKMAFRPLSDDDGGEDSGEPPQDTETEEKDPDDLDEEESAEAQ